jgi:hypothetical protein
MDQNPLAPPTPNNLAKEFGHPYEIQNIYLDFASFPKLPPLIMYYACVTKLGTYEVYNNMKNLE